MFFLNAPSQQLIIRLLMDTSDYVGIDVLIELLPEYVRYTQKSMGAGHKSEVARESATATATAADRPEADIFHLSNRNSPVLTRQNAKKPQLAGARLFILLVP